MVGRRLTTNSPLRRIYVKGVLLYTDSINYRGGLGSARLLSPVGFAGQALENLNGYGYDLAFNPNDLDMFLGNAYDLIGIDDSANSLMYYQYDALTNYVRDGGRLVICSFDEANGDYLWTQLGYSNSYDDEALPVRCWQPTHAIFTFPNAVPDLTAMTPGGGTDSAPGTVLNNAEVIAGTTTSATGGEGEIFLNHSGRTVLNSFLLCNAIDSQNVVPNDLDDDGKLDAVELWENEIAYVMQGDIHPVLLPMLDYAQTKSAVTRKNATH